MKFFRIGILQKFCEAKFKVFHSTLESVLWLTFITLTGWFYNNVLQKYKFFHKYHSIRKYTCKIFFEHHFSIIQNLKFPVLIYLLTRLMEYEGGVEVSSCISVVPPAKIWFKKIYHSTSILEVKFGSFENLRGKNLCTCSISRL